MFTSSIIASRTLSGAGTLGFPRLKSKTLSAPYFARRRFPSSNIIRMAELFFYVGFHFSDIILCSLLLSDFTGFHILISTIVRICCTVYNFTPSCFSVSILCPDKVLPYFLWTMLMYLFVFRFRSHDPY